MVLHGLLAWSNEVIEKRLVSSKTDNDCWSNEVIEEPPSLIKDR